MSYLLQKIPKQVLKIMEKEVFVSLYGRPFAELVNFNVQQLRYRYEKLIEVDTTIKENQMEYLMRFDSFIALFRAMFLERGTKQYTIQNYYRTIGQDNLSTKIDNYLDQQMFSWTDKTIREILKFLADKFVCHVDPISTEDLGLANYYMSHLGNPYVENNLQSIMKFLLDIVSEDYSC